MKLRFLLLISAAATSAFGQGSLTPPGAPAPTMKTLDQIESRTPIPGGSAPYTISASGSYYLAGNLTMASGDAITITAANVTLDLNGFTVATTAASPNGTAIKISGRRTTVCNGTIVGAGTVSGATFSGAGFANGVLWTGAIPQAITVRDVMVTGCSAIGIKANLVERCVVQNTGATGITGTIVKECQSDTCGGTAIFGSLVSDSFGSGFTGGISGGSLSNCQGTINGDSGSGINCTVAQNSVGSAFGTGGTGLTCTSAQNSVGTTYGNGGAGLSSVTAQNCVGTAAPGSQGTGLSASGTALNCQGTSDTGTGLFATDASTCKGISVSSPGLNVTTGSNCYGETVSGFYGIGGQNLINSYGSYASGGAGSALFAGQQASNCTGVTSGSGKGIFASTATNCYGSTFGPVGIQAIVSIGCRTSSGSTISTSYPYNQP